MRYGARARIEAELAAALVALVAMLLLAPTGAPAASRPRDTLTYLPYGFTHNKQPAGLAAETYEQLSRYGIGQALLPLPNFKKNGALELSRTAQQMFALWCAEARSYDARTGAGIAAVASIGGKVKGTSLKLEEPAVRADMLAGIRAVLALGAQGVSLDLEPYPTSHGFVLLLQEIRGLLDERGLSARLSVTAPANVATWSTRYLEEVTPLLDQVDPLFYDSERRSSAAYEQWVREGLAHYSAGTAAGTRIVPDLPSYGTNRWHDPSVENISTATTAVEEALREGSRVNGAGLFWWWGFYYDEEGEGSYNGAADREAWLGRTLLVPFTP